MLRNKMLRKRTCRTRSTKEDHDVKSFKYELELCISQKFNSHSTSSPCKVLNNIQSSMEDKLMQLSSILSLSPEHGIVK